MKGNDLAQFILHDIVRKERRERFERSDQLSLGGLIDLLNEIDGPEKPVVFDFGDMIPLSFDSWRGSYDELGLDYESQDDGFSPLALSDFISLCKNTVGKTFVGWKGGEYLMDRGTPVWVAKPGTSGNTALIDVLSDSYQVVLLTGYREY